MPDETLYQNSDIVETLRHKGRRSSSIGTGAFAPKSLLNDAADEIERLRKAHDDQVEAAWRLQDIVTRVNACIRPRCEGEPWDIHASHVLDEIEKVMQDA